MISLALMGANRHEILWPELIWLVADLIHVSDSCMGKFYSTIGWICSILWGLMCAGYPFCIGEHVGCCGGSGKLEMEDGYIQTQLMIHVLCFPFCRGDFQLCFLHLYILKKQAVVIFWTSQRRLLPEFLQNHRNIVHPQKSILLTSVIFKPLFHQQTVSLSRHNFCAVQWIQQITCPCILYHSFPLSYFETNCSQHLDLVKSLKKGIIAH